MLQQDDNSQDPSFFTAADEMAEKIKLEHEAKKLAEEKRIADQKQKEKLGD